jgi:hypothetical protein
MRKQTKVRADLTQRQADALASGGAVIIKPDQMKEDGSHEMNVSVIKAKRLNKKDRGTRLQFNEADGEGFLNVDRTLNLLHGVPPKSVLRRVRDKWQQKKTPRLFKSPPVQPFMEMDSEGNSRFWTTDKQTTGKGVGNGGNKELIERSHLPINVGPIYFDTARIIRPNQPSFNPTKQGSIKPTGVWT